MKKVFWLGSLEQRIDEIKAIIQKIEIELADNTTNKTIYDDIDFDPKFEPAGDRILIKPVRESIVKGSLLMPGKSKERPTTAYVVSIGDGVKNARIGDKVLIGKYSGVDSIIDDKPYIIIHETDILGYIEKEWIRPDNPGPR